MKISFNRRMEVTADTKAEDRRSLARTFATTTDVTVEEGGEKEKMSGDEEMRGEEERGENGGEGQLDPWKSD